MTQPAPYPESPDVYKYLDTYNTNNILSVKHRFWRDDSTQALCGRTINWVNDKWLTDKDGLAERRVCKKCESLATGEVLGLAHRATRLPSVSLPDDQRS